MEELKVYNLPQNVEGGMPINGFMNRETGEKVPVYFDKLDGMKAHLRVGKGEATIEVAADTKLIYEDGEYRFGEEIGG